MAFAAPRTLTAQAPVQWQLDCQERTSQDSVLHTALHIQYRVQGSANAAFVVHAALLPPDSKLGLHTPVTDPQLGRHALGVVSSYAPSAPGAVQEAVFSLPEWFCADTKSAGGRLVLHLRAANPKGQLPSGTALELMQVQLQRDPPGAPGAQ